MFGSEILDVAIGLILLFLLLSLVVSSIKEALETVLNHRAKDLERGVREMLGDRQRQNLVPEFYRHPLIFSLFRDDYRPGKTKNLPSYIPSRTFALALIDMLARREAVPGVVAPDAEAETRTFEQFSQALSKLPAGSQLRGALEPLARISGGKLHQLQLEIERWFDSTMDRVAGWYKRRTQIIIAAIGLVLAVLMNVDTLAIVRYLNTNQTARAVIMSRAAQVRDLPGGAKAEEPATTDLVDPLGWLERQGGIPLGWQVAKVEGQTAQDYRRDWRHIPESPEAWVYKLAGLLFTAFAVSLGAPFWFDLLNRFMVVRDTVKPTEKSPDEHSKENARSD